MTDPLELGLRAGTFVVVLALLMLAQHFFPLRVVPAGRGRGERDNLLLFASGVVCTRLLPWTGVGIAFLAQQHALGLSHWLHLRLSVAFVATLLLLDAALYLQHRLMHSWRPLWALHRVHHSDRFLDATSALRFHPGEILLSVIYKAAIIVVLGAPPAAVLCFELLLNACAMFGHSNLGLSPRVDSGLRRLLVTPAMHWIHHSIRPQESRHNYGFCLTLWDRLFGTYQHAPQDGYGAMQLGIEGLDEDAPGVVSLLLQPGQQLVSSVQGSYLGGENR